MSCSSIVVSEYCEEFSTDELWKAGAFLNAFECAPVDFPIGARASRIRRERRASGKLIADNDLLIASRALDKNCALITDNTDHFRRIDGLEVIGYR